MKRSISEADRIRAESILKKNSRIGAIVLFLYANEKGLVDHTQLANAINVKKNNLSNIVKRIEKTDVIRRVSNGQNKYYYLTDIGFDLYDYVLESELHKKVAQEYLKDHIEIKQKTKNIGGGSISGARNSSPIYAATKK